MWNGAKRGQQDYIIPFCIQIHILKNVTCFHILVAVVSLESPKLSARDSSMTPVWFPKYFTADLTSKGSSKKRKKNVNTLCWHDHTLTAQQQSDKWRISERFSYQNVLSAHTTLYSKQRVHSPLHHRECFYFLDNIKSNSVYCPTENT